MGLFISMLPESLRFNILIYINIKYQNYDYWNEIVCEENAHSFYFIIAINEQLIPDCPLFDTFLFFGILLIFYRII